MAPTSMTARRPPPPRFERITSPPHCLASSRAIGRPRPVPLGPRRPALPRLKRSKTACSSPGSRPGPSSSTSIPPGPHSDRHGRSRAASSEARSRPASRAPGRGPGRAVDRLAPRPRSGSRARSRAPSAVLAPALGGALGRFAEVDGRRGQLVLARPAQDQQLVDDRREPVDLSRCGIELARTPGPPRETLAEPLERQAQAGERRAQLMRGVGDEVLLDAQQALDPVGHLVEGARQRALLGAALDLDRVSRSPPATRRAASSRRRIGRAICWAIRAPAIRPSRRTTRPSSREVEDRGADRAVDGRDALGDPHRSGGRPCSRIGAAVARISAPSVSLSRVICSPSAAQGGLDLGSVGVAASRRRPRRSRRQATAANRRRSPGRARCLPRSRPGSRSVGLLAGASSSVALAATTSAWLRACPRTSASTRSRG